MQHHLLFQSFPSRKLDHRANVWSCSQYYERACIHTMLKSPSIERKNHRAQKVHTVTMYCHFQHDMHRSVCICCQAQLQWIEIRFTLSLSLPQAHAVNVQHATYKLYGGIRCACRESGVKVCHVRPWRNACMDCRRPPRVSLLARTNLQWILKTFRPDRLRIIVEPTGRTIFK